MRDSCAPHDSPGAAGRFTKTTRARISNASSYDLRATGQTDIAHLVLMSAHAEGRDVEGVAPSAAGRRRGNAATRRMSRRPYGHGGGSLE